MPLETKITQPISQEVKGQFRNPAEGVSWLWPTVVALALLSLRLLLVTFSTDLSLGFNHDSAYIAIVARNLLAGKGFVNDASWLVFLHPASLPMPYHNANPLYPALTALTVRSLDIPLVFAGLLVSAFSNVLLVLAAFYLLSYWIGDTRTALLISTVVAVFPQIWSDSLRMLPDSLHLLLIIAGLAFFVRGEKALFCVMAGISLGAAWLTRSTASLVVPSLIIYALGMWGWRKGAMRLGLAGGTALLLMTPWLVHTAHVWGSPFRSDASYYEFQDFYALSHDTNLHRYWHSITVPPSPGRLLETDGREVVRHTIAGIPVVVRAWLRWGWEKMYFPRIVFGILLAVVGLLFWRRFLWPPLLASAVYGAVQIVTIAIRADSAEPRYLAPLAAFSVLWLGVGIASLLGRSDLSKWTRYSLMAACAVVLVYIPRQDTVVVRQWVEADTGENRGWMRDAADATLTNHEPVVMGFYPYFYTYDTGAQALSIPESSDEYLMKYDEYLMKYMDQYNCRWIILTYREISFWKPDWMEQPPSWLRVHAIIDGNTIYERVPAP